MRPPLRVKKQFLSQEFSLPQIKFFLFLNDPLLLKLILLVNVLSEKHRTADDDRERTDQLDKHVPTLDTLFDIEVRTPLHPPGECGYANDRQGENREKNRPPVFMPPHCILPLSMLIFNVQRKSSTTLLHGIGCNTCLSRRFDLGN